MNGDTTPDDRRQLINVAAGGQVVEEALGTAERRMGEVKPVYLVPALGCAECPMHQSASGGLVQYASSGSVYGVKPINVDG